MWDLEGKKITGRYLAVNALPVSGTVLESRVAYGGTIKHTVQLDEVTYLFGTDRTKVILDHSHIDTVDGEKFHV